MTRLKLFVVLLLSILALFTLSVWAEEESTQPPVEETEEDPDKEPVITADYVCVYNVESGEMLYSKGVNTVVYPGSLVKIMTAAIALDYYASSNVDEVTVTESALETLRGNNIKLKAGETVKFYDLVAAVAVGGANDAALVIAEVTAGSVDAFVEMMNEKAKSLGAVNTQFANPTGFHSPRMYTTLSDLALICSWANKNTEFMKLSSMVSYTMPATNMSKERVLTNANLFFDPKHWLRHYKEGVSGMNVGMTNEAGYTLAAVYNNDGQTNIVIMVGGKVDGWDYLYFNEAAALMDYTATSYEYKKLASRDEPVFDMKVLYGKDSDHVLLATKGEVTALLPEKALEEDITYSYTVNADEVTAPVKKGTEMGSYNVYYQGELVSAVPLVTMGNVRRDTFAYLSGQIKGFFKNEIVSSVIFLIFSVAVFTSVIAYMKHYKRKKQRLMQEREARRRRLNRARNTIKRNSEN